MTSPVHNELIDAELIELAEVVLRQADYAVEQGIVDSISYLLAEDQDNVVTITAVLSADDAQTVEPVLTRVLVDRLSDRSVESKKWDGYVIILTSTRPDDDTTEALFGLTYNLNQVRRLIRVGIEPTTASVARGLRAILPLSQTPVDIISTEPLAALQARLVADGLDEEQVEQAMLGFRSHGDRPAPSGDDAANFEEEDDDQLIDSDEELDDEDA